MKLTDLSVVREVMARHGVTFQKKFGQNFLINPEIPRRIAEAACPAGEGGLGILEIGPGIGTLTCELAERADAVTALEIDTSLIPVLAETLAAYPNVTVRNEDCMKTDLDALCREAFTGRGLRMAVAANLPYYITTPVIMKLVESRIPFESITVMIQKEVAVRLTAPPGDSEYGAITAALAYYGKVERLFNVAAGNFLPAPKVDSAVTRITLYKEPPVSVRDEAMLFRTIRGAFAQRRKTLSNSLASEFGDLTKSELAEIIVSCGFDASIRGERLGLGELARLADAILERRGG